MRRSTVAELAVGVATCAVVLSVGLGPGTAEAVQPVPVPSVPLPAALDNAAFYEPQTVCNPTPQPGSAALANLLVATYGAATVYIPRACTSSTSEHFDGRAVDWMRSVRVPAQKEMVDTLLAWLLAPDANGTPHAMARRLGIMYIIWNNQMIRMYDPGRGWTNYRNCLDASNAGESLDTSCHRNHVHFSLTWDGAAGFTSWWTGAAVTLPYCSARSSTATPSPGAASVVTDLAGVGGLVPVAPTTILDTSAGAGAGLAGGCRLLAGRSLFPRAAGTGVVPAGVRWAAVTVTSTSNAPASLAAWSSGATKPAGVVGTPIGTTTSTLLVPIASDGTIGLATTLGAAHLTAQVVGYVPGDPVTTTSTGTTATGSTASKTAAAKSSRPSKPRSVTAKSARRAVTTRWKAPKSAGSTAIVGYRVEALTTAKKSAKVAGACTTKSSARRCTIAKLKKGKRYWMSVSVANAAGSTWAARKPVRVR